VIRLTTIRYLFLFICILCCLTSRAQHSVLKDGMWYKVAVQKSGVYKITHAQLKKMGFNPAKIDPRKIKIYGQGGGMLPQENHVPRAMDLVENSIFVAGENDGIFHSDDYILWYAEGPDKIVLNQASKKIEYESNLYSNSNYYFITVSESNGKRISIAPHIESSHPVINYFDDYIYHEKDEYNELKSGREWYGERFDFTTQHVFKYATPGLLTTSPIHLTSDVVAQTSQPATIDIRVQGSIIGSHTLSITGEGQYDLKGRHHRDSFTFLSSYSNPLEISYTFNPSSGRSTAFLDNFIINFQRTLALYDNQTIFRTFNSMQNDHATYSINGFSTKCTIWDITNPQTIIQHTPTVQGSTATFTSQSDALRTFIVFNSTIPSPTLIGAVGNQNLRGASTPNIIIITHPLFLAQAERLATHRSNYNQASVLIATPEQIYNEFSSGRQDVSALRDFVKHVYDKQPNKLHSLLLFGRSSYDYKDRVEKNTNFVPTYESRNSLNPLETYSSDDYFGFLENSEGAWLENFPADAHTLDIGVGRLPVKTLQEAEAVVSKLIQYDTQRNTSNAWRKSIVFVADDGSNSDGFTRAHQSQADAMAENIEALHPIFDTRKIFFGSYAKTVRPNGESIPEVNKRIKEEFDKAFIINYTGHGSEYIWGDEHVLTEQDIDGLKNKNYPLLVTATCEFGRQDNPAILASAERSVLNPNGGAIGLVTTSRPVYSFTNFTLNQAFYAALFQQIEGQYGNLGEVFRQTKNNSISGVSNRNFALIGDPSMSLHIPTLRIRITNMTTTAGQGVIHALSNVTATGQIEDQQGNLISDFNGVLHATLFDKRTAFTTIGRNNPPFDYSQWYNALFRGKATIKDGQFELSFTVPKNIAYEVEGGKFSLFATEFESIREATGVFEDFTIGGSDSNTSTDDIPPTIKLFIGDTTFIAGGWVNPNTTLLAHLHDNYGISISNYGIGNTLMGSLDNDAAVFPLHEYYVSELDAPNEGWITFPLTGLSPGKHTLTVRGWDVHNNPAQATIEFYVTDTENLQIESFYNYPNPAKDRTNFVLHHNRSGDDLAISFSIMDVTGASVIEKNITVEKSDYQINLFNSDESELFFENLSGGIYFARVVVRSLTNASKSERITKLIVVK
jgi:hypothetical protein